MIELRGMAWDHPRGYEPLKSVSKEFKKMNPGVSITWDIRSLKEFGDMPIEELIDGYDLITIDHPYMGQAHKNGLLLKLERHISKKVLATLEKQSVGPSFKAYTYDQHVYALPIDAAALVSSYRKDTMEELGLSLPETHEELDDFYKKLPQGFSVAWALCPTDLWCTFLTLCAQFAGPGFINNRVIDRDIGCNVLRKIKYHLDYIHPESLHWNPIQILDRMGEEDEIIYSPYIFGYTNYSRKGYTRNLVNFSNSPRRNNTNISTILGGVGLAVSARSNYQSMAVSFVEIVAGADIQEGIYTLNGGQPGNLIAWQSGRNDQICNSFFSDTISTLEKAYLRPRHPGWNQFQDLGASLLHSGILKNRSSENIMDDLNDLYNTIE